MKSINEKKSLQCFKGDQNIFWDGFICDLALSRYLDANYPDLAQCFFVHDEKLGTPDINWAYYSFAPTRDFLLSDDYADSHGDACYVNLDVSEGLFYLPALGLETLSQWGIPVRALAKEFARERNKLDQHFLCQMSKIGLNLNTCLDNYEEQDDLPEDMREYFCYHPQEKVFYLFTKAQARKGLVPARDSNRLFSSIKLKESNLKTQLRKLFDTHCVEKLIAQASHPEQQQAILSRAMKLRSFMEDKLSLEDNLLDLEREAFNYFLSKLDPESTIKLQNSSEMFLNPEKYKIKHHFFHLAHQQTELFSQSYNQALDSEKKAIQRLKADLDFIPLPYYMLQDLPDGRYRFPVYLAINDQSLWIKKAQNMELISSESKNIPPKGIIGKAMPFLNELSSAPFFMAMPEEGSKYASACKVWAELLRKEGFELPDCKAIRISLNALDHIALADPCIIKMPLYLQQAFGREISNLTLAETWRTVVGDAEKLLHLFKDFKHGQEVKFVRLWFGNFLDKEETSLIDKYLDPISKKLLKDLYHEFNQLHSLRGKRNASWHKDHSERYRTIHFEIRMILSYFKKNLTQWMIGLPYLNHRPYFLAFFLFFGESFIRTWLKKVTFRWERW
jgi:hypothetical protein